MFLLHYLSQSGWLCHPELSHQPALRSQPYWPSGEQSCFTAVCVLYEKKKKTLCVIDLCECQNTWVEPGGSPYLQRCAQFVYFRLDTRWNLWDEAWMICLPVTDWLITVSSPPSLHHGLTLSMLDPTPGNHSHHVFAFPACIWLSVFQFAADESAAL